MPTGMSLPSFGSATSDPRDLRGRGQRGAAAAPTSGEPPPNQRMKLPARGGRLKGNWLILFAAAAGRSLCAIR
jgi:hypothetical protein